MSRRRGVQEARQELPALLADAERGRSTVITRHGRSVAALVPVGRLAAQKPLLPLAGSGSGLWGRNVAATVRRLRGEWSR